jgi:DNA-binding response OmpR family regulator
MNILIADDDPEIRHELKRTLEKQQYRVETVRDGASALEKVWDDIYDLVILDIMMPKCDGMQVLQEIRRAGMAVPILMLTARGEVDDRIQGLDAGADDYLAKPFSMSELLARIRAMLRRSGKRDPLLQAGTITLDTVSRKVTNGNQGVKLTAKEFSILEFLLYNQGRAVSRFNLAEHVWGDEFDPFTMSNFIDVHLKNLRRKIRNDEPSIIRTIRGVGFIIDE